VAVCLYSISISDSSKGAVAVASTIIIDNSIVVLDDKFATAADIGFLEIRLHSKCVLFFSGWINIRTGACETVLA